MAGMRMHPVVFTLHSALSDWQWTPFPLFVLALLLTVAYWYLQGVWALASRGRRWSPWRTASFLAGLVAVDLAIQSPVAAFTASYFEAHVVQHLLLMIVAPPLLALGAPSTLLLQTTSRKIKTRWLRVLRSWPFAVLTHPITAWFLYFGIMFVFFLTPLINAAMLHMWLMDLINVLFLLGACIYWWPIVGKDPIVHWRMGYGAKMLNLVLGAAPETFLGIAIMMDQSPIASMYSLSSTHVGGAMLWVSTEVSTVIGFVPVFLQWARADLRAAARADAANHCVVEQALQPQGRPSEGWRPSWSEVISMPLSSSGPATGRQLSVWEAAWLAKAGSIPRPRARGSVRGAAESDAGAKAQSEAAGNENPGAG